MSKPTKKTITLEEYQISALSDTVSEELNSYLDRNPDTVIADIDTIISLLEAWYLLGYKKNAIRYRKDIRQHIKTNGSDDDTKFALEELRKLKFEELNAPKKKR